ncbi:MAG: ATP-binding protein [Candidatus Thorarchaeota archaeon]
MNQECCIACGECIKACRYGVYEKLDEKPQVTNVQYCKECGECIKACENGCIRFRPKP